MNGPWLTAKQAAERLQVHQNQIYFMVKMGLKVKWINRKSYRIHVEDLDAWEFRREKRSENWLRAVV